MRGMAREYAAGNPRGPGWRESAGTLRQLQAGRQSGSGMPCSRAKARLNWGFPRPALWQMQGESARRAGDPSHQSEDPPPEGLGGHGPFAQTDPRRPAGQVIRHHLDRQPGAVGGEAPRRHVVFSVNYFQPSFKLLEKTRDGARVIKRYSPPATPCDRVMQPDEISARVKQELRQYRAGLDPVALLSSIREAQSAMAAMSSPQFQETPHRESIDRFLARLPSLWQQGEARPTHKARVRPPRHWRTRKDPFEGVWCDVLLWLQKDPDTNAKDLLAKLREVYPGRFRRPSANAAAQGEGLAWRHGQEAGLRHI